MIDQINLYQAHLRDPKQPISAIFIAQSAGAFIVVLLVIAANYSWKALKLYQQNITLEQQATLVQKQMGELAQHTVASDLDSSLVEEVAILEERLRSQKQLADLLQNGILDDPSRARAYSDHLTALARQHIAGLWLTRIILSDAGHDLTLHGKTTAPELVPRYIQNLAQEPVLEGIGFATFHLTPSLGKPDAPASGTMEFWMATTQTEAEEQP